MLIFSPTRRIQSEPTVDEDDSILNASSSSTISNKGLDRSDSHLKVAWRGRKAAAKALRLPVVNKRNLFSLSWNLENQLSDFQTKYANSFTYTSALRYEFFDALASSFISGRWFSEAAVCHAHCIAIIGKELEVKGVIKVDWSLLNMINEDIVIEENVFDTAKDKNCYDGYTTEDFTSKIEQTLQTLVLSERYEAVGPLCRLAIPIYENNHDYKALSDIYAELQQACCRAEEIKHNGKRHLGSYFRVVFYGATHFGNEHKSEWIYREPRLTSLAEACDRMIESVRQALGHDNVKILPPERDLDESKLKSTVAYVQLTHVEPCLYTKLLQQKQDLKIQSLHNNLNFKNSKNLNQKDINNNEFIDEFKTKSFVFGINSSLSADENDLMCYKLHTNIKTFVYEERITDEQAPSDSLEQARIAVKQIILTVEKSFPSTRRRQRVVNQTEFILNPLEVACNSLLFKAAQIRKILSAAGITRETYVFEKISLRRLDLKQLQLFLQGSVSPAVNAGVLAYAEAFTAKSQIARFGNAGILRLISAFKVLMTELSIALRVNEAAIGNERNEYQFMLRNSFDEMLKRLSYFFPGQKFILTLNDDTVGRFLSN